jgi:murein DD-endopeptidase MepM/ murein hydrolase activator NlpD
VRSNRGELRRIGAALGALLAVVALSVLAAATALGAGSGGISPGGGGTTGEDGGAFPLRGSFDWGDGFGAGRGHEGQDLMTDCGRAVLAAYPGRVQVRDYHPAAGNYVVIDGAGKLLDTAYMHLREPTELHKRERVEAGHVIGRVGQTGDASVCHLHFEIWSQPGWYEGGEAIDPEPYLRSWKRG